MISFGDTVRITAGKRRRIGRTGRIVFIQRETDGSYSANVYLGDGDYFGYPVDQLELVSQCPQLDLQILDSYSRSVFEEFQHRKPEWTSRIINNVEVPQSLDIILPSLHPESGHLIVSTANGDLEVIFLPDQFHFYYNKGMNISQEIDVLLKYLQAIFDEDLVALKGETVDLFEFFRRLSKGNIKHAVSWKGNYNFLKRSKQTLNPPAHIVDFLATRPPAVKCEDCDVVFLLDQGQFGAREYICPECHSPGKLTIPSRS